MGNNGQFELLDILTIFSVMLQITDHNRETARMGEDDSIMKKLDTVIENQKAIMERLAELG